MDMTEGIVKAGPSEVATESLPGNGWKIDCKSRDNIILGFVRVGDWY
jgi:hypothetical protein